MSEEKGVCRKIVFAEKGVCVLLEKIVCGERVSTEKMMSVEKGVCKKRVSSEKGFL